MSAIWRLGEGVKFYENLPTDSSKKMTIEGGGVKNRLMFADVLNGWSLEINFIFSAMQVVTWFKKRHFKKKLSVTKKNCQNCI